MERISDSERIASFGLALANARDLSRGVAPETATRMLEAYFPSRKHRKGGEPTEERTNDDRDQADMRHGDGSAGRDGGAASRNEYHFWLGAEGPLYARTTRFDFGYGPDLTFVGVQLRGQLRGHLRASSRAADLAGGILGIYTRNELRDNLLAGDRTTELWPRTRAERAAEARPGASPKGICADCGRNVWSSGYPCASLDCNRLV